MPFSTIALNQRKCPSPSSVSRSVRSVGLICSTRVGVGHSGVGGEQQRQVRFDETNLILVADALVEPRDGCQALRSSACLSSISSRRFVRGCTARYVLCSSASWIVWSGIATGPVDARMLHHVHARFDALPQRLDRRRVRLDDQAGLVHFVDDRPLRDRRELRACSSARGR